MKRGRSWQSKIAKRAVAAADSQKVARMLNLWDKAASYLHAASMYLQQGNYPAEVQAVQASDEPNQQGNYIARSLGIDNCADVQL